MVLFPYSFHTQQPPHRPISESKPHEQCLISLEIRRLRRFPRSQVQDAHRVFSCVLVLVWGWCCCVLALVVFLVLVLASFLLVFVLFSCVFFSCFWSSFFSSFFLLWCSVFPDRFRSRPGSAGRSGSRGKCPCAPVQTWLVAGGPFRPDSARHGSTRIRIDKRRNMSKNINCSIMEQLIFRVASVRIRQGKAPHASASTAVESHARHDLELVAEQKISTAT